MNNKFKKYDECECLEYKIIKSSDYFSDVYYLSKYHDVKQSGIDPIVHYILYGASEGRSPSEEFENLKIDIDRNTLDKLGLNPVVYLENKRKKSNIKMLGCIIEPISIGDQLKVIRKSKFFNAEYYTRKYDIAEENLEPEMHYLIIGSQKGFDPSPFFNTILYKSTIDCGTVNPLVHFEKFENDEKFALMNVANCEIDSNRKWQYYTKIVDSKYFDKNYYQEKYPDINRADIDPYMHFLAHGGIELRNPSKSFSTVDYFNAFPAAYYYKLNPIIHYELIGVNTGYNPISVSRYFQKKNSKEMEENCVLNNQYTLLSVSAKQKYNSIRYRLMNELVASKRPSFDLAYSLLRILIVVAEFLNDDAILIFTNDVDPMDHSNHDGYFQRIKAIDNLLKKKKRIYIKHLSQANQVDSYDNHIQFRKYDQNLGVLYIDTDESVSIPLLNTLLAVHKLAYIHSIGPFRLSSNSTSIINSDCKIILDFHGVVPEEFRMYEWYEMATEFERFERYAVKRANYILCVTNKMRFHINRKYNKDLNSLIQLPILSETIVNNKLIKRCSSKYNTIPKLLYSGGAHKWQKANAMCELLSKLKDRIDFLILTTEPEQFGNILSEYDFSKTEIVDKIIYVSHRELDSYYKKFEYGICLRDDSIVNDVACPTKLVEYISYGLVPILEYEDIGDFKDLGMKYITVKEILNNGFPSHSNALEIVNNNYKIIQNLKAVYKNGVNAFDEIIKMD